MLNITRLLIAAPLSLSLLAAPAAHAEWRDGHHGGEHHGWEHRGWEHHERDLDRRPGPDGLIAGALVGLGIAAIAGIVAAQPAYQAPAPAYYAPPPPYYPAPTYYPGYYAPPTSDVAQ